MDGSLTSERARTQRLEVHALRSLVENGLREHMPFDQIRALPKTEWREACKIQKDLFELFKSSEFTAEVVNRAKEMTPHLDPTELETLELRWAAVKARMAAHEAVAAIPAQQAETACHEAEAMLRKIRLGNPAPDAENKPSSEEVAVQEPEGLAHLGQVDTASPLLTPGVALITGRITAKTLYAQRDAALSQPVDEAFSGIADQVKVERIYGQDLFGTAVRMCRKQTSRQGSKDQKLKSVALFIYTTGVQLVTDIRTHHIESFARILRDELPKTYWKAPREQSLTFKELREINVSTSDAKIGLAAASIERHVTALKSVMTYARREGHHVPFLLRIAGLVPQDPRTEAEKRAVFTETDVQRLFAHPLWSGCKNKLRRHQPGQQVFKDHHYWINLILALTGARRGEIAGLLAMDVLAEGGIPYVYIRPNHLRGLKKVHCKRRIPLHPQILELGFLDFVESARDRGAIALFPEAIPARSRAPESISEHATAIYNEKFGDGLDHIWRECLTRALDGNPERYTFHSLRHYVNDTLLNLRAADGMTKLVNDTDRRDLLGHQPIDVNEATYRREEKPLGPLFEVVKLLPCLAKVGS
ncbi:hypothetical protein EU805_09720 [Salipiger sp. IMCC34102]|uniref:hypothetical protein n=1 Tax=Salipiger sp. IMCC34102 TaxID=2510647 RepID=UPI00101DA13F|nr:hypothetical protein [Salipiger sp. IMCC34102]RYH02129.1 hypothetical protein EU805_09720 [Salipiger sp. IMCC34102]